MLILSGFRKSKISQGFGRLLILAANYTNSLKQDDKPCLLGKRLTIN